MTTVKRTARRDPATVMNNLFKDATENPSDTIIYARDSENPFIWWVLIRGTTSYYVGATSTFKITGPNGEFADAEFLFKLEMDSTEPQSKAPKFWPMTPNTVYKMGSRPCIGIGEYHQDQYLATLGPRGFSMEVANGLNSYPELGGGMHLIYGTTSTEEKKKISAESRVFNWQKTVSSASVKIGKYGDEKLVHEGGNRNVMEMMEIQYAKQLKKWLKTFKKSYKKDPGLAGRLVNELVRKNYERDPNYINDLRWNPDPNYDIASKTGLVDIIIEKFLSKPYPQLSAPISEILTANPAPDTATYNTSNPITDVIPKAEATVDESITKNEIVIVDAESINVALTISAE